MYIINEVNSVECTGGHYSFGIRARVDEFLSKGKGSTQGYEFLHKITNA